MPTIRDIAEEYKVSHRVVEEFLQLGYMEKPYDWNEENRNKFTQYLSVLAEIKTTYFVFIKNTWYKTRNKKIYDSITCNDDKSTWHELYIRKNGILTFQNRNRWKFSEGWVLKKYRVCRAQTYLDFYDILKTFPEIE